MKVSSLFLLIAVSLCHAQDFGTWVQIKQESQTQLIPAVIPCMSSIDSNRLVMFGGSNALPGETRRTDWNVNVGLWLFDFDEANFRGTWTAYQRSFQPAHRTNCFMAYQQSMQEIWLFGGWDRIRLRDDLWSFSLATKEWKMHYNYSDTYAVDRPKGSRDSQMQFFNSTHILLAGGANTRSGNLWTTWLTGIDTWILDTRVFPAKWSLIPSAVSSKNLQVMSLNIWGNTALLTGGCHPYSTCAAGMMNHFVVNKMDIRKPTSQWTWTWEFFDTAKMNSSQPYPSSRIGCECSLIGDALYCFGGVYKDPDSFVRTYYNDIYKYDLKTSRWQPLIAYGSAMPPRWYFGYAALGDKMFIWGGTSLVDAYDDMWVFYVNKELKSRNSFIQKNSIQVAQVDRISSVQLSMREWICDAQAEASRVYQPSCWGNTLKYAQGLKLSAFLTKLAPYGSPIFVDATVSEVGLGVYNISYKLQQGSLYGLVVRYDNQEIIGSPFKVALKAASISPTTTLIAGNGVTTNKLVKGKQTTFSITGRDKYKNYITSPSQDDICQLRLRFWTSSKQELDSWTCAQSSTNALGIKVTTQSDGSFLVSYTTPKEDTLLIDVLVSNTLSYTSKVNSLDAFEISNAVKITLRAFAALGIAINISYFVALYKLWDSPIIKASTPRLLLVMNTGSILGLITVFLLGEHTDQICRTIPFMGGAAFALLFGSFLATTWRIDKIFSSTSLRVIKIHDFHLFGFVLALLAVEFAIDVVWSVVDPLKVRDALLPGEAVLTYQTCDSENNNLWYGLFLGHKALMLIWVVFLATKTRNVPSLFNEAKTLAVVVYTFFLTCLFIVPIIFIVAERRVLQYVISCIALILLMVSAPALILLQKFLHRDSQLNTATTRNVASKTSAAASTTESALESSLEHEESNIAAPQSKTELTVANVYKTEN